MDPTAALKSIETALRLVIRDVLGDEAWLTAQGAPERAKLEERRTDEARKREAVATAEALIDYTDHFHLESLIVKNWDDFKPVFDDQARLKVYFGVLNDVRNALAHSRDLVPYESDLLSGIAGHVRQQIALYRGAKTPSERYYPRIEKVVDNFNFEGGGQSYGSQSALTRLELGDVLIFTASATRARGKALLWRVGTDTDEMYHGGAGAAPWQEADENDGAVVRYEVQPRDVGEQLELAVSLSSESTYHRFHTYDDRVWFRYAVNPPMDD